MARSRDKRTGGGTEKSGGARVLQTLRERITRHDLPPGSKLLEKELGAEFGVSRARIREVMAVLEQRGLIRRIPNRGAVVERLDPAQVFHIYHVREALEGVCARLATQNMPPESWQDLVELFGEPIDRDVATGDLEGYIVKLETLRRRTIDGARNPVLADMLDNIQDRTRMIIRRIIILPGRAQVGAQQHRTVLQAMRRGDATAAEEAKRANMRSAVDYLHRYQSFVL